jgi:large subunit ribosomal protein L4
MPILKVVDNKGKELRDITLSDDIFGIKPNVYAMHLVVVSYLANQRQGTQSTKTRSEVSGGGRKPWRQKGTGNARQGSTRSPQWRHGGIALGPKPREYGIDINKKVRRLALKSALSAKAADGTLVVLDSFGLEKISTKTASAVLTAVGAPAKALIILPENDLTVYLSARNIPGVKIATPNTINVYDILNAKTVVLLETAAAKIQEVYA